jgi:hypothetical protein
LKICLLVRYILPPSHTACRQCMHPDPSHRRSQHDLLAALTYSLTTIASLITRRLSTTPVVSAVTPQKINPARRFVASARREPFRRRPEWTVDVDVRCRQCLLVLGSSPTPLPARIQDRSGFTMGAHLTLRQHQIHSRLAARRESGKARWAAASGRR